MRIDWRELPCLSSSNWQLLGLCIGETSPVDNCWLMPPVAQSFALGMESLKNDLAKIKNLDGTVLDCFGQVMQCADSPEVTRSCVPAHCSPDQQSWMTESREPNADDDVGCLGRLSLSQTSMRQTARNIVSLGIIEKITINHVDYNFGRDYILNTTEENA